MIKITGSQPKQMTVFFGNGSISVGTAESKKDQLMSVFLADNGEAHKIGEPANAEVIQDAPPTLASLTRRSVILSYPISREGVQAINVLVQALICTQNDIINRIIEEEVEE